VKLSRIGPRKKVQWHHWTENKTTQRWWRYT